MLSEFKQEHWSDSEGRPAGGVSHGTGFCISWQNGPLGRGSDRREPNGAFVETIIAAARGRLSYYQDGQFRCTENAEAIGHLNAALNALNSRTASRESRGIEGTHEA